jgi:hypothetical protein
MNSVMNRADPLSLLGKEGAAKPDMYSSAVMALAGPAQPMQSVSVG